MPSSPLSGKLIAILAFVLFANLFFFHHTGSLGSVVIQLGFFLMVLGIWAMKDTEGIRRTRGIRGIRALGLAGGIVMVVLAIIALIRANETVQFLTHIASWFTIILSIYLLATWIPFVRSLMELVLAPVLTGVAYLRGGLEGIAGIGGVEKREEKGKEAGLSTHLISIVRPLVVGLIVGVPVVVVILVLLRGADPIFSAAVDRFFNLSWLKTIPQRIFFSIVLFLALLPLLHLTRKKEFTSPISFVEKLGWVHEMSVVMAMVAMVIGAFLVIQWPYVFVNVSFETDLSKFGVKTYSEYVQRGFIELLLVSFIVYGVVWLGRLGLLGKKAGQKTILPALQLLVLGEMAIFIASIFRRIALYQEFHGWSIVRIYGGFFLVWVAFMTATLALRHLLKLQWVRVEAGFTLAIVLVFGFFNAENFIVTHHPPTVNKHIDYVYLSRMSPDGYEGWKKAYEFARNIVTDKDYQQKALLTRDERRDVAYAGLVLHQLTRNYHILLHEYGTPRDLRSYYQEVVAKIEIRNDIELGQMQDYQKRLLQPVPSNYETVASSSSPLAPEEVGQRLDTAEKTKKKLDEVKSDLKKGNMEAVFPYIFVDEYSGPAFFEPGQVDASSDFYHLWFQNEVNSAIPLPANYLSDKLKLDSLDRLYIWNWSKAEAYGRIKEDIPRAELFDLQQHFSDLAHKISMQASNEWDYEIDISFNTPFLDPL